MANWTQDKLEEVVKKKHEEAEKKKPKTDIVSNHVRCICLSNMMYTSLHYFDPS